MARVLTLMLAAVLGAPLSAAASEAISVPHEVTMLVLFERSVSENARATLHSAAGATVTGRIPEVELSRVSMPPRNTVLYERSPLVAAVQKSRTLRLFGPVPNDPLLNLQWPLQQVEAFKGWEFETGKKNSPSVAVIDTGVDATHTDLKGRVLTGFDFLEIDEDSYDDHGHGTHVAGVIAANVSNREGIAGINHGTDIIPMKTCTDGGACPLYETYAGVVDAVRRGAGVINMSLGAAGPCGPIDQTIFDWVRDQGVLTVVAAGNAGARRNPTIMPANCDNTLAVGAVDTKGKRAEFSSYGDFVDIAAPGVEVWSTLPPLVSIMSPHIGYGPASGTSMACPHVAAAASLVKAKHPDWAPEQVERKLMKSAVDAGPKGRDDFYGHGLLNLPAALR